MHRRLRCGPGPLPRGPAGCGGRGEPAHRSTRRRRGKTDAVDAEAAARAALSGIARALPKSGDGHVEALRMRRLEKNSAVKTRTQSLNRLKSVLVNAPSALREELEPLSNPRLLRRCAELADTPRGQPGSRHGGLHAAAAGGAARLAASTRSHRARKANNHSDQGYRNLLEQLGDGTRQRGGPADHCRRQGTAGQ
ncbi:IS110 family transposase [Streptomyces griseorubiginosus]|uniref:IS110 family transposase n=1 Tax=Streptomyces griseorubiginosus TaxID=67304 RepID=UPI003EBE8B92